MNGTRMALDIREAAHQLSLSPWTIRKWIAVGKIKAVRLGSRVLVEPAELRRLIEQGRESEDRFQGGEADE